MVRALLAAAAAKHGWSDRLLGPPCWTRPPARVAAAAHAHAHAPRPWARLTADAAACGTASVLLASYLLLSSALSYAVPTDQQLWEQFLEQVRGEGAIS